MFRKYPSKKVRSDVVWPRFMSVDRPMPHRGVARSQKFMATHFQTPVQLQDLVVESGMSRRGLIKAFHKHVGRPPAAVLRQMRIEKARHLLVTEDLSLKELAERVGFRSANTFCVAFLRSVGIAPKKYQRLSWLTICQQSPLTRVKSKKISSRYHRKLFRPSIISPASGKINPIHQLIRVM